MKLSKEEFFQYRIERVKDEVSLYDTMVDFGAEPRFEDRASQMRCCFSGDHGKTGRDNKPSARFYPGEEGKTANYYCWVCTPRSLDVIGFTQRAKGISFPKALRLLEAQHHIKYDEVELSADVAEELKGITSRRIEIDPQKLFVTCENLLRDNRQQIGMVRFIKVSYVLDKIYFLHCDKTPAKTTGRIATWLTQVRSIL